MLEQSNPVDTRRPPTRKGQPGEFAGLGLVHAPDIRDHPLQLAKASVRSSRYYMSLGPVLDQGSTSQCVGYSSYRLLTSHNVVNTPASLPPGAIYRAAQKVDEWPGEEPAYEGTSVRAAMKVLQREGYISGYQWARDAETVMAYLLSTGPVLMGTVWTREMFMPDRYGFITDSGPVEGGHAYLLIGGNRNKVNPLTGERGAVRMLNSWGEGWGDKGRAWISMSVLQRLIDDAGEACVAQEIKRAA